MLRVAAYTGGLNVPSARFRVRQYVNELRSNGVELDEMISQCGSFPPENKIDRLVWLAKTLVEQPARVAMSRKYDVTLLQREIISTYYTFERFTKKPRILDVDDAIFLNKSGYFAKRLAKDCQHIICGNDYLANWFGQWNKNISVQATAIDTNAYKPIDRQDRSNVVVVGWIGTSSNQVYFEEIKKSLEQIVEICPNVLIRIVSDSRPKNINIKKENFEFVKWTSEGEIESIQGFDIGIMPLKNTEMAKGKCSFKMLQYMSCGKPVIVSPVGMNSLVLEHGNFGFGPKTADEWIDALRVLVTDQNMREKMGRSGREVIVQKYSIDVIGPKFSKIIKSVV